MRVLSFKNYRYTFTIFFRRLSPQNKSRTEDIILRILLAMGDFVLTLPLEIEINELVQIFLESGSNETTKAVEAAKNKLSQTIGELNAQATQAQ